MFKTITSACLVALASSFHINGHFVEGAKAGLRITDTDEFDRYECPEPDTTDKADNMKNMFKMGKMMAENQFDLEINALEVLDDFSEDIAIMYSVFDPEYEGSSFCAGLTIGYEGRRVVMDFGKETFLTFMKNKKH